MWYYLHKFITDCTELAAIIIILVSPQVLRGQKLFHLWLACANKWGKNKTTVHTPWWTLSPPQSSSLHLYPPSFHCHRSRSQRPGVEKESRIKGIRRQNTEKVGKVQQTKIPSEFLAAGSENSMRKEAKCTHKQNSLIPEFGSHGYSHVTDVFHWNLSLI